MDVHNTTILYSMKENKYPSLETLEEAFNDESRITFVDLFVEVCDTNQRFHKRKISMNTCLSNVTTKLLLQKIIR